MDIPMYKVEHFMEHEIYFGQMPFLMPPTTKIEPRCMSIAVANFNAFQLQMAELHM